MSWISVACAENVRYTVTNVFEETQHLIVGSIVRDEESEVGIPEDSSNSDETCSSSRYDAYVFPGVLTLLALTMVGVVEIGDSCT